MSYTTLARVQDELRGTEANKTAPVEQKLMEYIRTVTTRIRGFKFEFEPQYAAEPVTPTGYNVDSERSALALPRPLLEVKAITVGGVAGTYGTAILPDPNNGQTPIWSLRLASPRSGPIQSWFPRVTCDQDLIDSIILTGFWGVREYYPSMGFFDSAVTCPAMTATQRTIVVSDVTGPDSYGRSPLFSPGNLIRIDDELSEVVKVASTTKTLTLLRGMNGTLPVTHGAGKAIYIWEPEEDIANMATRQACLLYARRGSYQQIQAGGIVVSYPPDLLSEIRNTIQRYNFL
jgi:hypothetical protein